MNERCFWIDLMKPVWFIVLYDPPSRSTIFKKILDLNVLERLEKKGMGTASRAPYLDRSKR